ncbi:MAG: hypothetical protein IPK76_22395 [Lewinellaceae bacterium]|nr:hypothetical protein [Lewinellaceae bacterium]
MTGLIFGIASLMMFQISFMGLCLAFLLLPIMQPPEMGEPLCPSLVYVPFALIMLGVLLSGFSVFGMKAVFFGYGFHLKNLRNAPPSVTSYTPVSPCALPGDFDEYFVVSFDYSKN